MSIVTEDYFLIEGTNGSGITELEARDLLYALRAIVRRKREQREDRVRAPIEARRFLNAMRAAELRALPTPADNGSSRDASRTAGSAPLEDSFRDAGQVGSKEARNDHRKSSEVA